MKRLLFSAFLVLGSLGLSACDSPPDDSFAKSIVLDKEAMDTWLNAIDISQVDMITPDTKRTTTVIILDDSGSMGNDGITAAKNAIVSTVADMPDGDRVAVIALNDGVVLPITPGADAKRSIADVMAPISANGGTPLGGSLAMAKQMITLDAARQRGFGTFRIMITTDGAASDAKVLKSVTRDLLGKTPIQLATAGIGIGEGHPLNLPGQKRLCGDRQRQPAGQCHCTNVSRNPQLRCFDQL